MVSVITWQTIYLNGIIHSFDLAKANMHVAEEKSVTHKTQNTRRAFLCVTVFIAALTNDFKCFMCFATVFI